MSEMIGMPDTCIVCGKVHLPGECKDGMSEKLTNPKPLSVAAQSSDDFVTAMLRIRQIVEVPYRLKHGQPLTWERGWVWEMISFIHHTVDSAYPPWMVQSITRQQPGGEP